MTLRDETWRADVGGLVRSLRGEPAVPSRHRGRLVAPIAVLAVAASAGVGWWWSTGGGDDDEGEGEPPPCSSPTGDDWTPIALHPDATGEREIEGEIDEGFLEFEVRDARSRPLDTRSWEVILEMGMLPDIPEGRSHGYWLYEELVVGSMAFDKTCFSANPEDVVANTMGTAFVGYETSCQPVGHLELLLAEGDRIGFTQGQEPGDC